MRYIRSIFSAGAVISALAACASTPPPVGELAAARAVVSQVETAGARYAPHQLRIAQNKLARAEAAMANEDHERARRLAEQAEVDARLARSLAESEQAREALAEVQRGTQALKQEL
ncbi:MAG: DUF4398 domain-containing protein, partial [Betaproteobacteria bacterium]